MPSHHDTTTTVSTMSSATIAGNALSAATEL
jgi:hypothetical protein